jgi:phosphomannomutase
MARTSASLAGEGNGGVIRRDLATGRDGLGAVLLLLELLAREATTLARVLESLPPIHIRRTTTVADRLHERAGALPGATDLGVERGVELMLEHGAWALVRASATEPVARVTVEGPDEQVDSLLRDLLERLEA